MIGVAGQPARLLPNGVRAKETNVVTSIMPPICMGCRHLYARSPRGYGWACRAYKGGIPEAIIFGRADHRGPLPDDFGFQFKAKQGFRAVELEGGGLALGRVGEPHPYEKQTEPPIEGSGRSPAQRGGPRA